MIFCKFCWIFNFPSYLTNLVSRLSRGSKIAKWNNKRCFIQNHCLDVYLAQLSLVWTFSNSLSEESFILLFCFPRRENKFANTLMQKLLPVLLGVPASLGLEAWWVSETAALLGRIGKWPKFKVFSAQFAKYWSVVKTKSKPSEHIYNWNFYCLLI